MDDLQELKSDVKEILQRSAVHNELLRQHEARSLALQAAQEKLDTRLEPVEDHVKLMNRGAKIIGAILVGLVIQLAVKKLLGLF